MMSVVQSGTLSGIEAHGVRVEASEVRGLPGFDIVGLPEAGIRESRVRVLAALRNSGFVLPEQRFVVNLAPADLRKAGSSFDLAIAIALLAQCGLCATERLTDLLIVGELSLDGQLRSVRGLLAQLRSARQRGVPAALIPEAESSWALLCEGMALHCADHLQAAVAFLNGEQELPRPRPRPIGERGEAPIDLRDVRGQQSAKRALEVAAAGGHNLLMVGPPGSGKTMLARRLPGLLPTPLPNDALTIATIASVSGVLREPGSERPFRAPHHSCSDAALVGGGDPIRPGEVTLAHGGVLFLDELPEFRRGALESLRPTMESGLAVIVRARNRASMPASPLIVSAMNPCPCGYQGHPGRVCRCSADQVERYRARVSGPLLDRFDLHVALPPASLREVERGDPGESSARVRERVTAARARKLMRERSAKLPPGTPALAQLSAQLEPSALQLLHRGMLQFQLSLRAYVKVLAVSRTIADLDASDSVAVPHVAEALQYRVFDREASPGGLRVPARARGMTPDPALDH
jgi:magnesium chelatase family protein